MTFAELEPALRAQLEQLGMDAGSMWSEKFREERGRDPEPEEVDERAHSAAEKLVRRGRKMLEAVGVAPEASLLEELQATIRAKFVEFALDS